MALRVWVLMIEKSSPRGLDDYGLPELRVCRYQQLVKGLGAFKGIGEACEEAASNSATSLTA